MTGARWRFAFSRRWLGYLALVVVFAVACVFLSLWQLARRDEARAEITRVEENWDAAPVEVSRLLPQLDSFDADDKYRPVTLTGVYDTDEQLLVRGRPLNSQAGFQVLVPLRLTDGTVFFVDRGWVPAANDRDAPESVPAAPSGDVTVVVRLKASEQVIPGRSAPEGQVATITLPAIAADLGVSAYTAAYGLMVSEDPAPASRPVPAVRPQPDEGPHLSYAFQWIVFGIMAFVALGWAVRHEYRVRNEDDPAVRRSEERRRAARQARGPSDADIEDALLDASPKQRR